jgi:murein L,D-transpeptidase YcbB/YkuD
MDVYLHHTPSVRLFAQSRRDFSHGCIRVEAPVELAKFVLAGQQEWNEERILAAMAAGTPSTVRLARPLPVVVFYTTALVEDDGRVFFLPDIYGHDRVLERALRER